MKLCDAEWYMCALDDIKASDAAAFELACEFLCFIKGYNFAAPQPDAKNDARSACVADERHSKILCAMADCGDFDPILISDFARFLAERETNASACPLPE